MKNAKFQKLIEYNICPDAELNLDIDGLMQKICNSTANTLEVCLFLIKPFIYWSKESESTAF